MSVAWHLGPGYTSGVDYNTAAVASGTSVTVSKPSGLVNGQTLRAFFYSQVASGATATAPSGWTLEVAPTSRRGGIYRKIISNAGAEPANYTWSTAGSGRQVVAIWLCDGEDSTPVDVAGTFVAEGTTATAASVSPTTAGHLATFAYWNNSSTTVSTINYPAGMTKLIDVNSPTTGNTSGIAIGFQQLSASGATGTRALTGTPTPVNMSAVSIVYEAAPVPVTMTGTGSISATGSLGGGGPLTGSATLTGTGSISATGARGLSATAVLAGGGSATLSVSEMDARIAAGRPVHWAHRGGSANWSEMTMFAYNNAYDHGARALEVSVHRSSDGVWIMSHDATLTRVTGQSYTISSTNSATMLGLSVTAPSSGGVIGRLEDVLDAYGDKTVILVDNKPGSFFSEFLDLLETYPNAHDQFIVKLDGQFGSLANFQAADARGFKVAGYWYPNNYAANLPSRAPYTDYIGMQYDATTTEWADIFSYGKAVWGHVIQDSAQYALCASAGVDIFQLANVEDLMPAETPVVIDAIGITAIGYTKNGTLAGTGAIAAVGVTDRSASATLTGTETTAADGTATVSTTAFLAGNPVTSAGGFTGVMDTAWLASSGGITANPRATSQPTLTGAGSIAAAGSKGLMATAWLAGSSTITASSTPQGSAARVGTGSIVTAGVTNVSATASIAGEGSISTTATTGATATRTGTGSLTAAGGVIGALTATVAAVGSTSAAGVVGKNTFASPDGTGSFTAVGRLGTNRPATLAGSCTILAAGIIDNDAPSGISGTGSIAAAGELDLLDFPSILSLAPAPGSLTTLIPWED